MRDSEELSWVSEWEQIRFLLTNTQIVMYTYKARDKAKRNVSPKDTLHLQCNLQP